MQGPCFLGWAPLATRWSHGCGLLELRLCPYLVAVSVFPHASTAKSAAWVRVIYIIVDIDALLGLCVRLKG